MKRRPYSKEQLTCPNCGKESKSLAGSKAHIRFCKATKSLTPPERAKEEVASFANADGIRTGVVKEEIVGGKNQKFAYDGDGVGWYGPGLEADMQPNYIRKPGQFS